MGVIAGMRKTAWVAALAVPLAAAVTAASAGPAAAAGRAGRAGPLAWSQTAEVAPADGTADDQFGYSLAVSSDGSTAVVGARNHNGSGAAYVFKNISGTWTQVAELTPSVAQRADHFGYSVAISANGSTVAVGAPNEPGLLDYGAVYVFSDSGGSWTQTARLAPSGTATNQLGFSVAISGNGQTIAAGAVNWKGTGAVFLYRLKSGAWQQTALVHLSPKTGAGDQFGWSVGLSARASTLVVGGPGGGSGLDRAYVYTHSSGRWVQAAQLSAADGGSGDQFGYAAAISGSGSTAVIGDPLHGSVYVFSDSGGSWTQTAELTSPSGFPAIGWSAAISTNGLTIVAGAPLSDGSPSGMVYVFAGSAGTWTQTATLAPSDGQRTDSFGYSVGVSATGSVAGAGAFEHNGPQGSQVGAAYMFAQ